MLRWHHTPESERRYGDGCRLREKTGAAVEHEGVANDG